VLSTVGAGDALVRGARFWRLALHNYRLPEPELSGHGREVLSWHGLTEFGNGSECCSSKSVTEPRFQLAPGPT
jgi:hypothetical protein